MKSKKNIQTIFYFLETGTLPWYSSIQTRHELQEIFKELMDSDKENFTAKLKNNFQTNRNSFERFVYQFDTVHLDLLLSVLCSQDVDMEVFKSWKTIVTESNLNDFKEKKRIYRLAFSVVFNKDSGSFSKNLEEIIIAKLDDNEKVKLKDIFERKSKITKVTELDEKQKNEQAIFYFLETGMLSPNSSFENLHQIQESFKEFVDSDKGNFVSKLKNILQTNQNALERFVNQFDIVHLELVLTVLFSRDIDDEVFKLWKNILTDLNPEDFKEKKLIYRLGFSMVLIKDSGTFSINLHEKVMTKLDDNERIKLRDILEIYKSRLDKLSFQKDDKFLKSKKDSKIEREIEKMSKPKSETEMVSISENIFYISNSGLVILHPFLNSLFENTGYLEKNEWINEEVQQRAVFLTQFMMTGNEEYPEFNLLLNKILCGYEIEKSLPYDIQLSEFEKNEANDLMLSVIKHWTALKNTSIDGLRNTFFLRDGKLTLNERGWLLQVEQKSVDILLNRLPWGISRIELPWMKNVLKTEWTS